MRVQGGQADQRIEIVNGSDGLRQSLPRHLADLTRNVCVIRKALSTSMGLLPTTSTLSPFGRARRPGE